MKPKQSLKKSCSNGRKKQKVNAVKNNLVRKARKVQSQLDGKKDEVQDLLNGSIATNNGDLNSSEIVTPRKNTGKRAKALKKIKEIKKVVNNGYDNVDDNVGENVNEKMTDQEIDKPQSTLTQNGEKEKKIVSTMDISVDETAQEAISATSNGSGAPGFLQRTMSKLWKIPDGITGQVPYDDITSEKPAQINGVSGDVTDKASKCIIS